MSYKRVIFLIIFIPILTSCWSQNELNNISIVTGMGIDLTEDGHYLLSFQVVNPKNVSTSVQGTPQGVPITIYEGRGDNIVEAAQEVSQHFSRKLYFAHADLIVLGEEIARKGIIEIFDAIERSITFRSTAQVVIAKEGTANDLLKILTPIDQVPSDKITKTLKFTEKTWGKNIVVSVIDVINELYYNGQQLVISGFVQNEHGKMDIAYSEDNVKSSKPIVTISAEGIGIFKDGKLIDWATEETARGIVFIRDKIQSTIVNIDWNNNKKAIGFRVVRSKTKIIPSIKKGEPHIQIQVNSEGNISEIQVPIDVWNIKVHKELEKKLNEVIKKEILQAIEFAKENQSDIFGFGHLIYLNHPKYWKKIENDWNESYFPNLKIDVEVNTYIRNTDLRKKPYFNELKRNKGDE